MPQQPGSPQSDPPVITTRTFITPFDEQGFQCAPERATGFLVMARIEAYYQAYESCDTLEQAMTTARKVAHRLESCSRRDGGRALDG